MAYDPNLKTQTSAGMETVDQTVARAKEQLGSAYVPPTPAPATATGTSVITPDSLKTNNAPVVTTPPVPTTAPKLQADLTAQTEDTLAQKNAADLTAATTSKNTAFQSYLDQLKANKGMAQLTADQYAVKGGVNEITPELNKINDQIRQEQRSLELAKRNVQQNTEGRMAQGISNEIGNLERVSLQKQADLSIIQQAVQGRYDSAKTIADRAVAAQFEEQQIKTDAAKFDYTENKDLFTKAEQRQYDMLFDDRQRKLDEAKQNKQDIYDLGLKLKMEGAPTSVMQNVFNAKTREEALALSGNYLGAQERQLKAAQIASANRANQPSAGAPQITKINGVDMQWNGSAWVNPTTGTAAPANIQKLAGTKSNIDTINSVTNSASLSNLVGTNLFSRGDASLGGTLSRVATGAGAGAVLGGGTGAFFGGIGAIPGAIGGALLGGGAALLGNSPTLAHEATGDNQNFLAGAEQLRNQMTLDALQNAKANGATFGALSEGELNLLKNSASKLNTWAITDNGKSDGHIIGYNTSEANFKAELDKVGNFAKLDYVLKGGSPEDVGVIQLPDGKFATHDSSGNVTIIN